ncbi:MAG: zf-HC2 domain-containing protein [Planctomycetota bacterium]|jgi:HEAT repeat protein
MCNTCELELISGYLDGELGEAEEVAVRVHLSECSECQNLYAALQRNRKLLQRHPQIAPSPKARERLAHRLDRDVLVVSRRIRRKEYRRLIIGFAAAAAILLFILAFVAIPALLKDSDESKGPAIAEEDNMNEGTTNVVIPEKETPRAPKLVPEEDKLVKHVPEKEKAPEEPRQIPPEPEPEEQKVAVHDKPEPIEEAPAPEETPEPETPKSEPKSELVETPEPAPESDEDALAMAEKEEEYAAAEKKLEEGLTEGNVAIQVRAVQDLARVDHPKTYDKLTDVIIVSRKKFDVRVRRQGILACGELSTPQGVKIIFQVSATDDPAVSDARIDALSLIRDEKTLRFLAKALKPGSKEIKFATPDGRRLIAVTIGNSGAAFSVEVLLGALRETPEKQFELRGALITAIGRTRHPQAIKELSEILLSTKSDAVRLYQRMLAAEALGLVGGKHAGGPLMTAYKRRQPEPIKAAITRSLGYCRHEEAVDSLIKQLGAPSNLLRSASFEALGRITGLSLTSTAAWKKWWKKAKKDYKAPENIDIPGYASKAFFRYHDIALYSENVVFVLDASISMAENGKAGWVLRDIEKAINYLSKTAQFNVICYNEQTYMMKPKLVSATDDNKRMALEFCKRWLGNPSSQGPSDGAKAISSAIAQNPDLIVYASNSLTGGEDKLELAFPTITARRLVREVGWDGRGRPKLNRPRIHVAGYFVPRGNPAPGAIPVGETPRAMRILAEETGGVFCYSWFSRSSLTPDNIDKQGQKK